MIHVFLSFPPKVSVISSKMSDSPMAKGNAAGREQDGAGAEGKVGKRCYWGDIPTLVPPSTAPFHEEDLNLNECKQQFK